MELIDLVAQCGISLSEKKGAKDGEMVGACPFCGGTDRFIVWPGRGRYWCRRCLVRGDAIQFLTDKNGMNYFQACETLGVDPKAKRQKTQEPAQDELDEWRIAEWQTPAKRFLEDSKVFLQAPGFADKREYLKGRGLNDETIAKLGWNPFTVYAMRKYWCLPDEVDERTGKPRKIKLPQGYVIPTFEGDNLHRLRVRLSNEEFARTKAWGAKNNVDVGRYFQIKGSGSNSLFLQGSPGAAGWVVVESELDAYLIHQAAGDIVHVLGLGSTSGKPSAKTLEEMAGKPVLIALDNDDPGRDTYRDRWEDIGEYWPVPEGKDPGDYVAGGGDIREWIEVGLEETGGTTPASKPKENKQEKKKPPDGDACYLIPCEKPGFRCAHGQAGRCFYKADHGLINRISACPMVTGFMPEGNG